MGLVLRRNLNRPLTAVEVDSNFEFLNITRWVQKSYLKDQFVYHLDSTTGNNVLYVCLADHDMTAYMSGFAITGYVNGTLTNLWTQIGGSGSGGGGGTVRIQSTTGTTIGTGIAASVYGGINYDTYGDPIQIFKRIQSLNSDLKVTYDGEAIYLNVTGTTSSLQPTGNHITMTPVTCNGGGDGSILIYATGGTNSRQFSINGVSWYPTTYTTGTSYLFSGLAAGNYTATVRDEVLGQIISVPTTVTQPTAVSYTPSITKETVSGITYNGAVTITPNGAIGAPYTISFNGGSYSSTTTYSGLHTGNYLVSVKDKNGCTTSNTITIGYMYQPIALISVTQTNATCPGGSGTATINILNGVPGTYQYRIDGGSYTSPGTATSYSVSASTGVHTLYAKDSTGKIVSGTTASITAPTAMSISSVIATSSDCSNSYNSGTNTATLAVTVTNANLNTGTYPQIAITINGSLYTTVSMASAGGSTYTYTQPFPSNGSYTVSFTVTDTCTTISSSTYTLHNWSAISATTPSGTAPTCVGGSWVYTTTLSGGSGSYQYSLDGTTYSSTTSSASIVVPASGTWGASTKIIYFRDANMTSCTPITKTVNNPGMFAISSVTTGTFSNPVCNGSNNGFIHLNIGTNSGLGDGSSTFEYRLISGTTLPLTTTGSTYSPSFSQSAGYTQNVLRAGYYNFAVNVVGSRSCGVTYQLATPKQLTQPPQVTYSVTGSTNPTACGTSDGKLFLHATGGTSNTYKVSIYNNSGTQVGTTKVYTADSTNKIIVTGLTGTGGLNYTVKVGDGVLVCGGSPNSIAYLLTAPSAPTGTGSYTAPLCSTGNATVTLNVTSGAGLYQYTKDAGATWYPTTGATTALSYSFNITPFGGVDTTHFFIKNGSCTSSVISVTATPTPAAIAFASAPTTTNASAFGVSDGTMTISPYGGTAPYYVTWIPTTGGTLNTSTSFSSTTTITSLAADTYTVTLYDSHACTPATATVTIGIAPPHNMLYYFRYRTISPTNASPNIYNSFMGYNNLCNSSDLYYSSTGLVSFSTVITYYKNNASALFGGGSIDLTALGLTSGAWGGTTTPVNINFNANAVSNLASFTTACFGILVPSSYPILNSTHLYDVSSYGIAINAYAVYPNSAGLTSPTNVTIGGINYYLYSIYSTTSPTSALKQFKIT